MVKAFGKYGIRERWMLKSAVKYAIGLAVAISVFIGLGGCSGDRSAQIGDSAAILDSIAAAEREHNDVTRDAENYADSIYESLSGEERIGMFFMPAVFARSDDSNMNLIKEYVEDLHVGGMVLLKGDMKSAAIIADSVLAGSPADPFLAIDAENGLRMRFPDAPEFPWSRELGEISDDQLLYEFGREIARECRALGLNMVLGPVVDVVPGNAGSGIMRKRSLGSNPRKVADLALAYARGLEDGNVISVAKHFPGHGSSDADSHRAMGHIRGSRERIDSVDLYPFRRYAGENLSGVMVGHLSVAALDSMNRPAVVSPIVMGTVLRGELGFRGLVITDALNMEGAMGVKSWEAIAAGADMVIAPLNTRREIAAAMEAYGDGRLTEDVVGDRCRRILFYKYLRNLGDEPRPAPEAAAGVVNSGSPEMQDTITSVLRRRRSNSLRM